MIQRHPCPTVRRFRLVAMLYRNAQNDCAVTLADKAVVAWWGTFEDYCNDRWGFSKTHSNRLIAAAETMGNLTPIGVIPQNESVVRPLTKLAPELQPVVWQKSVETAPNGKPTAARLRGAQSSECLCATSHERGPAPAGPGRRGAHGTVAGRRAESGALTGRGRDAPAATLENLRIFNIFQQVLGAACDSCDRYKKGQPFAVIQRFTAKRALLYSLLQPVTHCYTVG